MLFSALGWQVIAGPGGRPSGNPGPALRVYLLLRWIREAVNNLLPLAQIGGEIVVARLLQKRGVQLAPAIGGTMADLMMEMGTQILFTVLGLDFVGASRRPKRYRWACHPGLLVAALVVAARSWRCGLDWRPWSERAVLRLGRSMGGPGPRSAGCTTR